MIAWMHGGKDEGWKGRRIEGLKMRKQMKEDR
jgi:hypothetical protein